MGAVLGEILAKLALAFLREWLAREDLKRGERQRWIIAQLELDRAALAWKAEHPVDPGGDPLGDFRVRDGGGALRLPPDDPGAPGPRGGPADDRV